MNRKTILSGLLMASAAAFAQQQTDVREFCLAGPFAVSQPFAADTVDVKGQRFDDRSLLDGLNLETPATKTYTAGRLPSLSDSRSVGLLTFYLNNDSYQKATLSVKGPKMCKVFVDGTEVSGELKLAPDHHTIAIKYLAEKSDTDSIAVSLTARSLLNVTTSRQHPYMVHDLTDGRRVRGVSLSADGRYAVFSFQTTERGGNSRWDYELRDVKSGRLLGRPTQNVRWMPRTIAYLEETWEGSRRMLYQTDPLTGTRKVLAFDVPQGGYQLSPTEDYLILTANEEGPKEDAQVFQVLEMDDRQPGWRSRSYLKRYDLATGLCQRITFGTKGETLYDISQDGKLLLIGSSHSRLERRPTSVTDFLIMDVQTLRTDTVLADAEYLGGASFSPDGKQLLFMGNPEAFGRIGCQLPDSVTPSMTENELFLYDLASKQVTPLTKDFDPSVTKVDWSWADGQIYFSAEDRDYVRLYRLNPQTGRAETLRQKGDYAFRYDLATHAPVVGYLSYETLAPASAWVTDLKRHTCFFDGKTALGDAQVGTCEDWNFQNSHGDTVYGRLYLPADFDASRKYPLIVYYYGGCSPVSRYFESPYAPQYWNSLGYVAYILQPSGATGFGQEWASRHVNTAGHGPAEDIIEGVKKLCATHLYINKEKIGCMGASYGGFMTQYLQTQTDIFAAAVSHAGISNHTSYWGEGYWGYNYSEVSMANSYPWSHRKLYVDQSPLFQADKIHTPLLLLHGTADTNVPLIESLQMFTALKLLGREVALVEVEGENHHILDYQKREKWLATQMAWFQRWLKDDPSWWEALYPAKHL